MAFLVRAVDNAILQPHSTTPLTSTEHQVAREIVTALQKALFSAAAVSCSDNPPLPYPPLVGLPALTRVDHPALKRVDHMHHLINRCFGHAITSLDAVDNASSNSDELDSFEVDSAVDVDHNQTTSSRLIPTAQRIAVPENVSALPLPPAVLVNQPAPPTLIGSAPLFTGFEGDRRRSSVTVHKCRGWCRGSPSDAQSPAPPLAPPVHNDTHDNSDTIDLAPPTGRTTMALCGGLPLPRWLPARATAPRRPPNPSPPPASGAAHAAGGRGSGGLAAAAATGGRAASPGTGGGGSGAPINPAGAGPHQGLPLAGGAGPPPVPPPPAVAAAAVAPNERFFNWESFLIAFGVDNCNTIWEVIKQNKEGIDKQGERAVIIALIVSVSLGAVAVMASTATVGVPWVRRVSANLARLCAIISVVTLLILYSVPIGYEIGCRVSGAVVVSMAVVCLFSDPDAGIVGRTLRSWICTLATALGSWFWRGATALWNQIKPAVAARRNQIRPVVAARRNQIRQGATTLWTQYYRRYLRRDNGQ